MNRTWLSVRRSLIALVIGGFAAAVLAVPFGVTAQDKPLQKLTVRLDWNPHSTHSIFHLPVEKGWFARRGLQVAVEDGNGSGITVQTVGAGQFDIGYANLAVMTIAREKGLPVKSIAAIYRKGDMGVIVPQGSGIKTPKDLEGKRVIWTPGSLEAPFLDYFFRVNGSRKDKVNLVAVDAAAKIPSYAAGKGDATITAVPFYLYPLRQSRPSEGLLFSDHGLPLPSFGLFASDETLKNKKETIQAFVEVVLESWKYILDGHEAEGVESIIKARPQAKLGRDVLLVGLDAYRPFVDSPATKGKGLGWQAEEDWTAAIKVMSEAGLVRKDAKPSEFYTNEFIRPR